MMPMASSCVARSFEDCMDFVLTYLNWAGAQQGLMRAAAVKAGLIPDDG